jgi:hypothetical protein
MIAEAAAEPKQVILVEGADHRFSAHIGEVWQVFFHWLDPFLQRERHFR